MTYKLITRYLYICLLLTVPTGYSYGLTLGSAMNVVEGISLARPSRERMTIGFYATHKGKTRGGQFRFSNLTLNMTGEAESSTAYIRLTYGGEHKLENLIFTMNVSSHDKKRRERKENVGKGRWPTSQQSVFYLPEAMKHQIWQKLKHSPPTRLVIGVDL